MKDALEIAHHAACEWRKHLGYSGTPDKYPQDNVEGAIVGALSLAGLLLTPLHERALEACKRYRRQYNDQNHSYMCNDVCDAVAEVGREALAAEKPKGRWYPCGKSFDGHWWEVATGATVEACFRTEQQAKDFAAQKNAEEKP